MKNQMMVVQVGKYGTVNIGHKTQMGSLNEVLEMGNNIREKKGLPLKELKTYLRKRDTWELVLKVYSEEAKRVGGIHTTLLYTETLDDLPCDGKGQIKYAEVAKTNVFDSVFKVQTRGKLVNRGAWANLFVMLDLAQWLDVDLRYEVYKTFIEGKILQHRDDGGEAFKDLNKAIDSLPDRSLELKPKGNRGCYINIAKMIRGKINISNTKGYNDESHDSAVQKAREKLEDTMVTLINLGYVNSWDELKKAVNKY